MPELPEVELAARRLREAIVDQSIVSAEALHTATARSLTQAACRALVGRRVQAVERRAKVQLVHLDDGSVLAVHLRMTGDWHITVAAAPPPAYERARFAFDNGVRVSFIDRRALGVLSRHAPGTLRLPAYGVEPLSDAFTVAALHAALASRRGPIKPALLDQRVVAGLGNIYAAEALWVARIRPDAPANRIARIRVERLRDAIVDVLEHAPSTRYYGRLAVAAENTEDGPWRVYGREGEPCARCASRIGRVVQSGRSTFFCRRCQR